MQLGERTRPLSTDFRSAVYFGRGLLHLLCAISASHGDNVVEK